MRVKRRGVPAHKPHLIVHARHHADSHTADQKRLQKGRSVCERCQRPTATTMAICPTPAPQSAPLRGVWSSRRRLPLTSGCTWAGKHTWMCDGRDATGRNAEGQHQDEAREVARALPLGAAHQKADESEAAAEEGEGDLGVQRVQRVGMRSLHAPRRRQRLPRCSHCSHAPGHHGRRGRQACGPESAMASVMSSASA